MPTAIQVGLVPGFALQDGDKLAQLIGGGAAGGAGGGLGLGNTVNTGGNLTGSGNNSPITAQSMTTSILVVTTASATDNSVRLVAVQPSQTLRIYNRNGAAQSIYIFPPAGQSVDFVGSPPVPVPAGGSVQLADGAQCDYVYLGNSQWISDLLGSSSA